MGAPLCLASGMMRVDERRAFRTRNPLRQDAGWVCCLSGFRPGSAGSCLPGELVNQPRRHVGRAVTGSLLDRLASFSRVICFDKRGSGVSDPVPEEIPSLDAWDGRHTRRPRRRRVISPGDIGRYGGWAGGDSLRGDLPRAGGIAGVGKRVRQVATGVDYPIGMPDAAYENLISRYEKYFGQDADMLALTAPSMMADQRFRSWFTTYQRLTMPPGASTAMYRWVTGLDVRHVLPSVRIPALVIQRSGNVHHRAEFGRYLGAHIRALAMSNSTVPTRIPSMPATSETSSMRSSPFLQA